MIVIFVLCHDHEIMLLRELPNGPIVGTIKTNGLHMFGLRKEVGKSNNQLWRQILAKSSFMPCSPAFGALSLLRMPGRPECRLE
jgi:hypothetical protein